MGWVRWSRVCGSVLQAHEIEWRSLPAVGNFLRDILGCDRCRGCRLSDWVLRSESRSMDSLLLDSGLLYTGHIRPKQIRMKIRSTRLIGTYHSRCWQRRRDHCRRNKTDCRGPLSLLWSPSRMSRSARDKAVEVSSAPPTKLKYRNNAAHGEQGV